MDLKELRALLRLMEGSDLEELELDEGGRRVRIRRRAAAVVPAVQATRGPSGAPAVAKPTPTAGLAGPEATGLVPVESPMVGTFYRAPAPDAEPYVKEGDFVQKGTVVCIIEAMKLMNEIETEVAGRMAKVLVENGQPVEFGQPLFLIEPA
jgi:acetyl-CoA carboxylase biotin carboxyl carrier protein